MTLTNDFALSVEDAYPLLADWNTRCVPPWPEDELLATLRRAADAPPHPDFPRGCKLTTDYGAMWNDPNRLAVGFAADARWVRWRGGLYHYTGTHYVHATADDLHGAVAAYIQSEADRVYAVMTRHALREHTAARIADPTAEYQPPRKPQYRRDIAANVIDLLTTRIQLPHDDRIGLPDVISTNPLGMEPPPFLAVANGILDLDDLTLRRHTPSWFSLNSLPYDYDPAADSSPWAETLHDILDGDQERIDLIQEFFGYILYPTLAAKRYLLLYGDGGTGKSTVLAALQAMVGDANFSAVSLNRLGSNQFAASALFGKLVNISAESCQLDRFAEDTFKALITGDPVEVDRKYEHPFMARPTAKIIIATNVLPRFKDGSDGTWDRPLHVPFLRKFRGTADEAKRLDEAATWVRHRQGILNWSLAGLRRLRANNWTFTVSSAGSVLRDEHRRDSDDALDYVLSSCRLDPAARPLPMGELYSRFTVWCDSCGIRHRPKIRGFNAAVRRAFPGIIDEPTKVEGQVVRCWIGLAITE